MLSITLTLEYNLVKVNLTSYSMSEPAPPTITIYDVAEHAGVSAMTVSRVLNQSSRVAEATRLRIQQAISELGYVPNTLARGLKGVTRTLALIIPDVSNPFFTDIVHGAEEVAWQHGYTVFLGNTNSSAERERLYLQKFLGHGIDGLLIAPSGNSTEAALLDVKARRVPFVLIDANVPGIRADKVLGDNTKAAQRLTEHLFELGHSRVAYVGGRTDISTARERAAGYKTALKQRGLKLNPGYLCTTDFSRAAGGNAAKTLMALPAPPTAIVAANNTLAVGIVEALRELGQRVPEDVALVCFEDLELASALYPFLTVMAQPAREFGQIGTRFLLERIAKPTLALRSCVLSPTLIVRKSCGSGGSETNTA